MPSCLLAFFIVLICSGSISTAHQPHCKLLRQREMFGGGNQQPQTQSNFSTPGTSTSSSGASPSPTPLAPFEYGQAKIRGVSLGGWFVLEPWITPSLFQNTGNDGIVDEYTFCQYQDRQRALSVLENHWQTWITESDFRDIAAAGLNHVRIPFGYWSVPLSSADTQYTTNVDPYIPGAWPYFLNALNLAKKYGLHVIIDLHGAPGSQNGYDNSGQRIDTPLFETDPNNIARTLDILKYVVKNVGGMIDVLELLNEPAAFRSDAYAQTIKQFYADGYKMVRSVGGNGLTLMISDGFLGVQSWQNFLTYPSAQGVMIDIHDYQIFTSAGLSRSFDDHVSFACSQIPGFVSFAQSDLWIIIGEWSTSPTDCAKWLNGRGVGARWDNTWYPSASTQYFGSCNGWTGDWHSFSSDYKTFLRKYWEVQVEVGERIQGWVYWAWKTESADEWSYQKGLEGGWIPQDINNRMYPNICP